ncbi:uncharacterized protein LOC131604637 [Vicia villosa]|uniref:uncharacterized protein LOC131604637 n=1 Tax=Vicia villosa TaxID=3911 RepID=UPI00273C53C3|nr:uncharacterized protein LOC131604637 [Vicia villosa]
MIGYVENLEKLGFPLEKEIATDLMLQSLSDSFTQVVLNFNMNDMNKILPKLLSMLRTAEQNLKSKGNSILMGLQRSRELEKGEVDPRVGNGAKVAALAIGTYVLTLPSGLIIHLENCYYVPAISRNQWEESIDTPMDELEQKTQAVVEEQPSQVEQGQRRLSRIHHQPERYGYLINDQGDVLLMDQDEPEIYQEAISGPEFEKWLEAVKFEMDSMYTNQVWTLVEPFVGVNLIGCKWFFKKKTDMDGKILLAIATYHDYGIWQMDVKIVFLNRNLLKDVLHITHWKRCPYLATSENLARKCFSMKDLGEAAYILGISIYRDRSQKLLGLSQSTYIDKVLRRFNVHDSKKGFIPMQHGMCISKTQSPSTKEERDRMNKIPYASAIGSIMYAMLCTRSDVFYALSATSRYQYDPGDTHWVAVKNVLKYLRKTKDSFLIYGGHEELAVIGYTDASFQTDKDNFRSQSRYVFCLNGGTISWKSSKQDTVADSTIEAEYIVASNAAKESVWIKKFISELGIIPSIVDSIDLYCDNNGAIAQAKDPRSHQRSKHILGRYHLFRKIIDRGCEDMHNTYT